MSESYIVRIHRRVEKPGHHHDMVGVVEDPVAGRQQAFHDAEELWAIMEDRPSPSDKHQVKNPHHKLKEQPQ